MNEATVDDVMAIILQTGINLLPDILHGAHFVIKLTCTVA